MTEENIKKCEQILDYYGEAHQKDKLIEEAAELIQATIKYNQEFQHLDKFDELYRHFLEELADVRILVTQMEIAVRDTVNRNTGEHEAENLYNEYITTKLDRQLDRIAAEKEDYRRWQEGQKA